MKFTYLLIGLFVYLFIGSVPAKAGALSLSLDPSIIEINVLPPSNVSSTLTVQNKSDSQVTLQIEIREFKAKLENGELEYSEDSFSPTDTIYIIDNEVPVERITLGPGQQKKLTLNITIPEDINISDYYFSIIFVSENTSSPTSTASLNQLGIATNVLLSIGAIETPDAVLEEFSAGLFYESGPVPFTIRIKNSGTHFIKPKGEVIIKNMFGQIIGKLDLQPVNILADSIRAIPNDLFFQDLRAQEDDKKNKSNFDFRSPKTLWKEGFLLGFYTATLNISLSDDGPNFTKSIHFFAFPFQELIVIVIIAIAAIIIRDRIKTRLEK